MDGTCTLACIDFAEMRRRAGILEGDILEVLDKMPAGEKSRALKAIEEVELEALEKMQLAPGLLDLCHWLDEKQIPRGLITRNSQASVDYFHTTRLSARRFSPALCRDFRPPKPSPAALLHICSAWRIRPRECLMVGDSAKDDIVSGNRAGTLTALLDPDSSHANSHALEGELEPSHIVKTLSELQEIMMTQYNMLPSKH